MVNYPVSDMIIRIKNAYLARRRKLMMPYSTLKENMGKILAKERFLEGVKTTSEKGKKQLVVTLKYENKRPAITDVKVISRPSLRVYVSKQKIPMVLGGLGITILSTPRGVMTGSSAKKEGLGGELLLKVW